MINHGTHPLVPHFLTLNSPLHFPRFRIISYAAMGLIHASDRVLYSTLSHTSFPSLSSVPHHQLCGHGPHPCLGLGPLLCMHRLPCGWDAARQPGRTHHQPGNLHPAAARYGPVGCTEGAYASGGDSCLGQPEECMLDQQVGPVPWSSASQAAYVLPLRFGRVH